MFMCVNVYMWVCLHMCVDVYNVCRGQKSMIGGVFLSFFPPFICMCMWGVYCVCTCLHEYVHVCTWRPEEDIICLALVLSDLPFEARSLTELRACWFSARLVDYQVPEIFLFPYPLVLGLQAHVPWPGFDVGSEYLNS